MRDVVRFANATKRTVSIGKIFPENGEAFNKFNIREEESLSVPPPS